ncbi:ferredoxin [Amycolatopsis marina]|uniref:Ferredoxin n=1 Tax=Amycolatopsis marina TaxID=490629 RepID=A0A1I0VD58_9PSEU|nr:(4Fe-4S)-binding protein [Amycolatopsis marina]SFA73930.1 ferredoxin [Amycolatopsis marina]
MRIVADKDVCVGAGQCVLTDPEIFDQSEDDGTVLVLVERPADLETAREAIQVCPSQALSLAED